MNNSDRIAPYKKDSFLEKFLENANDALSEVEKKYLKGYSDPQYPHIFIAGTQRSGTTLLIQLMIAYFEIGYISNLMARFWEAPYFGALLFNELKIKDQEKDPNFISELGTTYGYDGPHEFGYFWQKWFPYNETHKTVRKDLERINYDNFRKQLAAIESVFDSPIVFKNPIVFSLNMFELSVILPSSLFLVCYRDPLYVAQSTLISRLDFNGNKDDWFSIKPKEYTWLKKRPYPEQIAGQIYYTEKQINNSLSNINKDRFLMINYEDLCKDPENQLENIEKLVFESGYRLSKTGFSPINFDSTNKIRLDDVEFSKLQKAVQNIYPLDDGLRLRDG